MLDLLLAENRSCRYGFHSGGFASKSGDAEELPSSVLLWKRKRFLLSLLPESDGKESVTLWHSTTFGESSRNSTSFIGSQRFFTRNRFSGRYPHCQNSFTAFCWTECLCRRSTNGWMKRAGYTFTARSGRSWKPSTALIKLQQS